MTNDTRTPLRKAVDKLIADGKIKQDKDLQEIFKLSKSTISAYLNNPRPGKRFITEFEKKFGINLTEFEINDKPAPNDEGSNSVSITINPADFIDFLQTTIKRLEKDKENMQNDKDKLQKDKEMLNDIIRANLAMVLSNQAALQEQFRGSQLYWIEHFFENDQDRLEKEKDKINTFVASGR